MNLSKYKNLSTLPVYPFLLGLYPVLYLWSANRAQQPAYVILPSLLASLAGLLALYLVTYAIRRNIHRAALLTTIASFYFLTYGHFANLTSGLADSVQPYLLPGSALLVLVLLVVVGLARWGGPVLSKTLNLIAVVLVLFQLVPAVPYYVAVASREYAVGSRAAQARHIPRTGMQQPRDVYFIMLDNYGRQDVLLENAKFDNSELVQALEQRGFRFPDCAQGNYPHTAPMIASILNMEYLDPLGIRESSYAKRGGYQDMAPLIQDNEVIRKFQDYGYHVVTFRGFMGLIDIPNVDTYVNFEKDTDFSNRLETVKFQNLYFDTTIFHAINEYFNIYPDWVAQHAPDSMTRFLPSEELLKPEFVKVYEQNLYAYDALEQIPADIPGPKFVYAHIYSAHWPFMMRPDGSIRLPFTEKMTTEGYVDAVQYTNSRILGAIDSILANSETEPIIILQGDHANGWEGKVEWSGTDRLKILSAYYLPDGGDQLLYDEISPVNNFRLIFQHYFDEPLELLPDEYRYLENATRTIKEAPKSCMSGVGD